MKKRIIMIVTALIVIGAVVGGYFAMPLIKLKINADNIKNIMENCTYNVEYSVDEDMLNEYKVFKALKLAKIKVDKGTILGEKQGEVYHANCYVKDDKESVLEFYKNKDEFDVNVKNVYEYLKEQGGLVQKILNHLPSIDNDCFVSLNTVIKYGKMGLSKLGIDTNKDTDNDFLPKVDKETIKSLRKCDKPADSVYSNEIEEMNFYQEHKDEVYTMGTEKKVSGDSAKIYIRYEKDGKKAEFLINLKKTDSKTINMPKCAF